MLSKLRRVSLPLVGRRWGATVGLARTRLVLNSSPRLGFHSGPHRASDAPSDKPSSSSSSGGGGGTPPPHSWLTRMKFQFLGYFKQRQLTMAMHAVTGRYKRLSAVLERLAEKPELKEMNDQVWVTLRWWWMRC